MNFTSRNDWQGLETAGGDRHGTSKFSFARVLDNNSGHEETFQLCIDSDVNRLKDKNIV